MVHEIECPRLWRITKNSLHNEGIYIQMSKFWGNMFLTQTTSNYFLCLKLSKFFKFLFSLKSIILRAHFFLLTFLKTSILKHFIFKNDHNFCFLRSGLKHFLSKTIALNLLICIAQGRRKVCKSGCASSN